MELLRNQQGIKETYNKETDTYTSEIDSLYDLYEWVAREDNTNADFRERGSRDGSKRFTGTQSFAQAYQFATQGWPDGLDIVEQADAFLAASGVGKPTYKRDVHGRVLDVGAYVSGRPDCWLRPQSSNQAGGKQFRIAVGGNFNADIGTDAVRNRGAAIMYVVDMLETMGHRVAIDIVTKSSSEYGSSTYHTGIIKAKDYDQPMNREKMAFALVNPSFFRRMIFGLRERVPTARFGSKFGYVYGASVNVRTHLSKQYAENYDVIFGNDQDKFNEYKDAERAIELIKQDTKAQTGINLDIEE